MKHYYLVSVKDGELDLIMPTSDDILEALETTPERAAFEIFDRVAAPGDFTILNGRYLFCYKTDPLQEVKRATLRIIEPEEEVVAATIGDPEVDAQIIAAAEERAKKGRVFTRKP